MTAATQIRYHVCPVCRREVSGVFTFWRHNDKAGGWCPMSGREIPMRDGGE